MRLLSPRAAQQLVRGVAVAGAVLAVVAVRVVHASSTELELGDRFRAANEREAAIAHYRRAVRWYAPLSPYPGRALSRLAEVARDAERTGNRPLALSAYRSMRAGILASRSFYTPHRDVLEGADAQIARLVARETPPPIDAGRSRSAIRGSHERLLREVPRTSAGLVFVALLGFAGWIAAAFLFASRAIDEEDRFVPREARRWGFVFFVGWALFVFGLLYA